MSVQTLPTAADLEAARLLLARLGVSAADLITSDHTARNPGVAALDAVGPVIPAPTAPPAVPAVAVPTFAEYVPIVAAGATAGSRKAYGTYWNKIVEESGTRRLDEITASQVRALGEQLRARRRVRANDRGGARGGHQTARAHA